MKNNEDKQKYDQEFRDLLDDLAGEENSISLNKHDQVEDQLLREDWINLQEIMKDDNTNSNQHNRNQRKKIFLSDAENYYNLSICHATGDGVEQSYEDAIMYCRMAANLGYAPAQHNVGWHYETGNGVVQDLKEAQKYYSLAARQGYEDSEIALKNLKQQMWLNKHQGKNQIAIQVPLDIEELRKLSAAEDPQALCNLGVCYSKGNGVPIDLAEAFKCFKRSADLGNAIAQNHTGYSYKEGRGVNQSYLEALKYFRMSAAQKYDFGQSSLKALEEELNKKYPGVKRDILFADQGDPDSQCRVAKMYKTGDGVRANLIEAVKYYEMAAKQRHAEAQYKLGSCYEKGRGVEKNDAKALMYYEMATYEDHALARVGFSRLLHRLADEQNDINAQFHLGYLHSEGLHVKHSSKEGLKYYQMAADQGHAEAQFRVSDYYLGEKRGCPQDNSLSLKYCIMSAMGGYYQAQLMLSYHLRNGSGVPKDGTLAAYYIAKAANSSEANVEIINQVIAQYKVGGDFVIDENQHNSPLTRDQILEIVNTAAFKKEVLPHPRSDLVGKIVGISEQALTLEDIQAIKQGLTKALQDAGVKDLQHNQSVLMIDQIFMTKRVPSNITEVREAVPNNVLGQKRGRDNDIF